MRDQIGGKGGEVKEQLGSEFELLVFMQIAARFVIPLYFQ